MLKNKRDKIYNNISLKDRLLQSNTYLPPAWMDINVFNFLLSFGKTCKSANVMTSRWRRHASRRRFWFDWTFKRRKKSSFVDFLLKFSAKRTFVMQISNRSRRSIATRDFAIPTLSMPTKLLVVKQKSLICVEIFLIIFNSSVSIEHSQILC